MISATFILKTVSYEKYLSWSLFKQKIVGSAEQKYSADFGSHGIDYSSVPKPKSSRNGRGRSHDWVLSGKLNKFKLDPRAPDQFLNQKVHYLMVPRNTKL